MRCLSLLIPFFAETLLLALDHLLRNSNVMLNCNCVHRIGRGRVQIVRLIAHIDAAKDYLVGAIFA